MDGHPRRKRIRLERHLYRGPDAVVTATISVHQRQPVFQDDDFASRCVELLRVRAEHADIVITAYCFMPDHVHLLVRLGEESDLVEFLRDFKSRSTRLFWEHGFKGKLWQRSFYDHILREDDDPQKHVRYILENPVRAGIVEQWSEYPWMGSLEIDICEIQHWET